MRTCVSWVNSVPVERRQQILAKLKVVLCSLLRTSRLCYVHIIRKPRLYYVQVIEKPNLYSAKLTEKPRLHYVRIIKKRYVSDVHQHLLYAKV